MKFSPKCHRQIHTQLEDIKTLFFLRIALSNDYFNFFFSLWYVYYFKFTCSLLLFRALVFAEKFFGGVVPAMHPNIEEFTLLALLTKELRAYNSVLEKGKLRDGIKFILNVSRHGNQYMQGQTPWVLVKGSSEEKYVFK